MNVSIKKIPSAMIQDWILSNLGHGYHGLIASRLQNKYNLAADRRIVSQNLRTIYDEPTTLFDSVIKESILFLFEQGTEIPDFVEKYLQDSGSPIFEKIKGA